MFDQLLFIGIVIVLIVLVTLILWVTYKDLKHDRYSSSGSLHSPVLQCPAAKTKPSATTSATPDQKETSSLIGITSSTKARMKRAITMFVDTFTTLYICNSAPTVLNLRVRALRLMKAVTAENPETKTRYPAKNWRYCWGVKRPPGTSADGELSTKLGFPTTKMSPAKTTPPIKLTMRMTC